MDIQKTGSFIKKLRTEQGLTQKELAEKLGCTDKAVSRWETGMGLPDASLLLELSDTFNISVNEILRGERLIIVDNDGKDENKFAETNDDNALTVTEFINKTDETIVALMQDKNDEIKKLNKAAVLLFVLCAVQIIIFYGLPKICITLNPRFESVVLVIYATSVNSLLAGLLKDRIRWIFPVFAALLLLFYMPFAGNEYFVYVSLAAGFFAGSAVIMAICSLIRLVITKIRNHKK